ncbi:branched-chain amino acid ABC transporter permease [Microbaculum marinisediminis]|uniref:Branched-chain amino acid ABC transporter permease n=1 Tax=Microbaculum marinisediminis TaxID=2931392 RepID=A0AAW5R3M9_9HYPH|nr:branched-chain amino acid ABC transporter permease [Microbaculum sp. A6E488]MCT8973463.1 branched-chain amino acid ABC transporter permease [Microbaculum sp. A6E488]
MVASEFKSAITVLVVAGILFVVAPAVIETYTLTVLIIYGMLALSLGLIWGFGGILCFGQAAFFGLGAYTYAIAAINIGESTVPFLLGIAVPFAFAFVLGAMLFYGRLSDVYLGVITLVVTLIFFKFMNSTAGPEYVIGTARLGGFNGIPGFQTLNVPGDPGAYIYDVDYYWFCVVAILIVYALVRWLLASPFGRIAVAIRENESRAELMGYDVRIRKTVLFAVGGAIAGLAGTLFANWAEIVTPGMFSLAQSAEIIIWCIVGGLGTLIGPVIGAMALAYLKFLLGQQDVVDNMMILGLILTLSVLFLPRGIVPSIGLAISRAMPKRRRRRRHRRPRRVAEEAEALNG